MIEHDVTANHPFPFSRPTFRQPGLHLSDVIRELNNSLNPAKAMNDYDELEPDEQHRLKLTFEAGFIWEDALSRGFGERLPIRYDNIQRDGIWMNPDGFLLEPNSDLPDTFTIYEYKCTSKKVGTPPSTVPTWLWQVKSYCWAFQALKAVFLVYYMSWQPWMRDAEPYKAWELEFTKQELQENWDMIVNFANRKGLFEKYAGSEG